jgi:hypothetical protein
MEPCFGFVCLLLVCFLVEVVVAAVVGWYEEYARTAPERKAKAAAEAERRKVAREEEARRKAEARREARERAVREAEERRRRKEEAERKRTAVPRLNAWYQEQKRLITQAMPDCPERQVLLGELFTQYDQLLKETLKEARP